MARSTTGVGVFLLLFTWNLTAHSGDVQVSLDIPRYAARGSSVPLRCLHNVQKELLYKVEWLKNDVKLFQYVRERTPPFRHYNVSGVMLNMSLSDDSQITLQDVDFSTSGFYSCEVSLDTPIFTKASQEKELIVIQPQRHPPRITFGAPLYTAGELVEANCTTSPAHPAPHITWFINGVKVEPGHYKSYTRLAPLYRSRKRHRSTRSRPSSTASPTDNQVSTSPSPNNKSCSARDVYGQPQHLQRHSNRQQVEEGSSKHGAHHKPGHLVQDNNLPKPVPAQRLTVAISALKVAASGRLALTCLATIPAYRAPAGKYGDSRNHTVIVDIVVAEELEPEPTEAVINADGNRIIPTLVSFLFFFFFNAAIIGIIPC